MRNTYTSYTLSSHLLQTLNISVEKVILIMMETTTSHWHDWKLSYTSYILSIHLTDKCCHRLMPYKEGNSLAGGYLPGHAFAQTIKYRSLTD